MVCAPGFPPSSMTRSSRHIKPGAWCFSILEKREREDAAAASAGHTVKELLPENRSRNSVTNVLWTCCPSWNKAWCVLRAASQERKGREEQCLATEKMQAQMCHVRRRRRRRSTPSASVCLGMCACVCVAMRGCESLSLSCPSFFALPSHASLPSHPSHDA